jgi:exopolysaccharide biosynthesis polyprenyl glycosylphosphotransferase
VQLSPYSSQSQAQSPTTLGENRAAGPTGGASANRPTLAAQAQYAARGLTAQRTRLALLTARIILDGLLLTGSFVLAYQLRYEWQVGGPVNPAESYLPLSAFAAQIAAYVLVTLLLFRSRGLYALPRGGSWVDQMGVIAGASFIGVATLTLGVLLVNTVLPSRLIFIYLWLCTLMLFALERFFYRRVRIALWRRGINVRKALVVGESIAAQRIMKDIVERPDLGYELVGYTSEEGANLGSAAWQVPIARRYASSLRRLGGANDIERVISEKRPHEVIVALPSSHHAQTLAILETCRETGVEFKLVPDLFEMRFDELRIDALNGVPLIGAKDFALRGANLLVKRVLDVAVVLAALLVAALPMVAIAAVVKLTSRGPVLFRQKRVGKGGRTFTCYKFRSMYKDAEAQVAKLRHLNEADGPIFKIKNDPRLTPFGKVLRRSSLDELPQLFNILKGDMSWVGPRPPTPDEVKQYNTWHLKRLDVTAGLTGLWQISGRSDLSFEEMVKLDLYYAENWSLSMDVMIMLRTLPAVLKRAGAY